MAGSDEVAERRDPKPYLRQSRKAYSGAVRGDYLKPRATESHSRPEFGNCKMIAGEVPGEVVGLAGLGVSTIPRAW